MSFRDAMLDFGRAVRALQPYADDLLVIGGLAAMLYRRVPGFAPQVQDPIATTEADWTSPRQLPLRSALVAALLEGEGFQPFDVAGLGYAGSPAAQVFQHERYERTRKAPVYQEFLTPQIRQAGIVTIQEGVRAQALRYLDLLAFDPITITVGPDTTLGLDAPCRVRVPQPALYIAQKILARSSGRGLKTAKDLAYAYDVATLCRPVWAQQADIIKRARAEADSWNKWLLKAGRELRTLFASPTAEGPVEAARIYRSYAGKGPAESTIRVAMEAFTSAVF